MSDASKWRPLKSSLDRHFSFSAIALRIMGVPPNRRAKLAAMPDEPSTPEICDRPLPGALTTDIGIVDLDPWPARAKLIAAVPLDHCLHQFVLNPPGSIGRDPKAPAQLDVGQPFLALGEQIHGAEPHPHRQLGALQDGAGNQRCLIAALPAL